MKSRSNIVVRRNPARATALAGVIVLGISSGASAVDNFWVGGTGDWNTATNWSLGRVPTNANGATEGDTFDDAVVNTAVPSVATITANLAVIPRDIVVGSGEGSDGTVNHPAGTAATGPGNWMFVGRQGATGTYNLADTNTVGTGVSGFGQGGGTLNANGRLYVGGWNSVGIGTLNVNTTGTLAIAYQLQVGNGSGSGVFNLESGTVTTGTEWVEFGNGAGSSGTFNMTGGTFTKGGADHFSIGTNGGIGTAEISGGALTVNNEIWLGQAGGSLGNLNFSGGTIANNSYVAIGRDGGTGNLIMTGGTWTKTGGGAFIVGASGPGAMLQSGGLVEVLSGDTWIGELGTGVGSFTLSDSGEFRANYFQIGRNANSSGTVDLQGGTLRVAQIAGGNGTEHIFFDSTQIIATANQANFIGGIGAGQAVINFGGLKIDSNGCNLGVPQDLNGLGGVVKSGAGTLTLSGPNSYEGGNLVAGGKLILSTATTLSGDCTVANGAGLGVLQTAPTATLSVPAVTFGTAAATTLDIDLGNIAGNPTAAPLAVTNALTLNGTVTVNIADAMPAVGAIPLVSYALPKLGGGSFELGSLPPGTSGTLADDGAGLVSLTLTHATLRLWKGTGATTAPWDIGITADWTDQLTGLAATYADPGAVLFNDTATTSRITLGATVAPGKITFNNTTITAYRLEGSGKITGPATLLKQGTGGLSILNTTANEYTGPTILEGGTTTVRTLANGGIPSAIGSSSASPSNLVLGGGTLVYLASAATSIDRGFTISGANSVISMNLELTMGGQVVCTAGNLTKTGAGKLTLTHPGANAFGTVNPGLRVTQSTLALTGSGTQTNAVGGDCWIGSNPNVAAQLVLTGTSLTVQSWLVLGRGNGNTGTTSSLTATDSTIVSGNLSTGYIGDQTLNNCLQTIVLTNSSWTNSGVAQLAENTGSTSTMTVAGTSAFTSTGIVFIGMGSGAKGTLNQTGGTFSGDSWIAIGRYSGGSGNSIGIVNVSGGAFNQTNPNNALIVGEAGTGTLTISGSGAVVSAGTMLVSNGATGIGTVNLNGGTLTAYRITEGLAGAGTGAFNFNGGTLIAGTGANADFMTNLDTATVHADGAKIDSNGQTIAISQALLAGGGNGGLTKLGTGFLQLNGTNTYAGPTTVTAGSLGGSGSVAGPLVVAAGASIAPGTSVGTFAAGATTLAGAYACEINGATADKLVVNGALDVSAGALVITELVAPTTSVYIIATYTGATPAAFGTVSGLPSGYTLDYAYNDGATTTNIALVGADPYLGWAKANITDLDPTADATRGGDPDGDGKSNITEFALDGNPLSGAATGKVVGRIANVGGSQTLVLTLPVRTGATFTGATEQVSALIDGVIYKVQGSDELAAWNLVVSEVTGTDRDAIQLGMPSLSTGWTYRTFQSPGTIVGDPTDFLRAVIANP